MKKLLALGLGLLLSFSMAACGTNSESTETPSSKTPTTQTTDNSGSDTPSTETPTDEWVEITPEDFKAAYEARENAPWNHMEGSYKDDYSLLDDDGKKIPIKVVENLKDNKWVVDTKNSDEKAFDITFNMIFSDELISLYIDNPEYPDGLTLKFEKKGDQYKMILSGNYKGEYYQEGIMDKYFYQTDYVELGIEVHCTWSTK